MNSHCNRQELIITGISYINSRKNYLGLRTFTFYVIIYINIEKNSWLWTRSPLDFILLPLPLWDFCIDMPDDGL